MSSALSRLAAGGFGIGIEAPLDNDWTAAGDQARAAGVGHVGLQFRRNRRPLDETFHEIAEHVLPLFHAPATERP